jgi:hypothetical protein
MAEIAIDYDNTYSTFKEEIDVFIKALKKNGHTIHLVTARNEKNEKIPEDLSIFDHVFYTDGKAKASVVRADLFVDDSPVTLCCDFVPGAAHAEPSRALHQGYKDSHILWNFEEGKFVSYVTKHLNSHAKKD